MNVCLLVGCCVLPWHSIVVNDKTQDLDFMITPITGYAWMFASVQDPNNPAKLPDQHTATWTTTFFNATEIRISHLE